MAINRLRSALTPLGVDSVVMRAAESHMSGTVSRARFNRALSPRNLNRYDAVLGVNGDGWRVAERLNVPYLALVKALYAGAAAHERQPARALLRLHARWEGEGARRASLVVVPSGYAAARVAADYAVPPAAIHVLAEPFDAAAWVAMLPKRKRNGNRVLCAARLYPRKRVVDLVDAWPLVRRSRPDARLDIVGGGPELRRLVRRSIAVPGCYLHGHVEPAHLLEFYARADVFCLPSGQETFGYAVVEAMASGLPIVIADAGSLPEVVAGAVADAVPVANSPALADAILRALQADVRGRAADANRQRVTAFASQSVAAGLLRLIDEARRPQRRAAGSC